jgi:hypothetical protein
MGMPFMMLEHPVFLRQELLGSEAVYEVIEEGDEIVTAEVVSVPGLPPGMRVELLAKAAAKMDRSDLPQPLTVAPQAPADAPPLGQLRPARITAR